jgi:hypothetical protein
MPLSHFHPAVAAWFAAAFPAATPAQLAAWEAIRGGRHALVHPAQRAPSEPAARFIEWLQGVAAQE